MAKSFDISKVQEHFPALKSDKVFFDNAGGSQILGSVATSIYEYLTQTNVQLGATYSVGKKSNEAYAAGYAAGAEYINATPEEVVIGPSTTQLFRNLSQSFSFPAGSELILSAIDHEANVASWLALAASQSLTIKWWSPSTEHPSSPTNPKLLASDLAALLTPNTKLVTCTHASNVLGTIHDIATIAKTVHTVPGAMLVVDAVAYAPHRRIDVKALGVDFYAFSWYKVYGPHISMLYGRSDLHPQLKSLGHYFNPHDTLQQKLGLAASNYELTASIPKVLEYFGGVENGAWEAIAAHEEKLSEVLLRYLRERKDVTIFGESVSDGNLRVPTISFTINGEGSKNVVETVEKASSFGFRWGAFYSNRLVENTLKLGKEGVVRVSMVHYNTVDEITAFVAKLDETFPPPR